MNAECRRRHDAALAAARQAGQFALQHFDAEVVVEWKEDRSPVTLADRGAEQILRTVLLDQFPGDAFLGEESGDTPGSTGFRWVIDPIDGTRSFVRGIPIWATLVGLEYQGEAIAGVCHLPAMNQTFHALRGEGAYRDGRRLRVSRVADLTRANAFYSSVRYFDKAFVTEPVVTLLRSTERQRGFGDFYGFVLVAQGSGEFMVEHGVHAWDVVALQPIVEEAGGQMTNWNGARDLYRPDIIASNGLLHDQILGMLPS